MHEITQRVLAEQPTAVVRRRLETPEIEGWIGGALNRVAEAVGAAGSAIAGPPYARCVKVDGTAACFDVEAGFPVSTPIAGSPAGDVRPSRLPGGSVAVTEHSGPYEAMAPAYEALEKWVAEQGGTTDGPAWECYLTAPVGDPTGWRTEVVQPYRLG